jgi:excinuclease UvrABC nuclease subunit
VLPPVTVTLRSGADLEAIPDQPAVFLLWAAEGAPYLAKTTLLRRRLRRLLTQTDRLSRLLRLTAVAERLEYWLTGSQLEAQLLHLHLAQQHFPEDWRKIARLRPPVLVRLLTGNPYPRLMVTTRPGPGVMVGPFASRAAAERYAGLVLELFQLRRCEQALEPDPTHPGCIYGEMNRCLRPCQAVVSREEYMREAGRVEQFLRTGGESLAAPAEAARDQASAVMRFEEAERLHHRVLRIREAAAAAGPLARPLDQLAGVAVTPSVAPQSVDLWFFVGGVWQPARRLTPAGSGDAGQSLDRRLRELAAEMPRSGRPNFEHLAVLARWHGSSWRDGEWIGFESPDKIPYRRLVNAVARVAGGRV